MTRFTRFARDLCVSFEKHLLVELICLAINSIKDRFLLSHYLSFLFLFVLFSFSLASFISFVFFSEFLYMLFSSLSVILFFRKLLGLWIYYIKQLWLHRVFALQQCSHICYFLVCLTQLLFMWLFLNIQAVLEFLKFKY